MDSAFLGAASMFQIVMAIPVSGFVWRVLFQIDYFPESMIIGLFIIIGIGADDILVLRDGYTQARQIITHAHFAEAGVESAEEREKMIKVARMQMAWDRTASSVLNTSLTTVIAFASLTVSDLPFMAALGGFIALMIFNLFLMTIFGFPAVLAVFYEYLIFKQNKCPCCLNCCCSWSPCCPAPYGAFKSRPEKGEDGEWLIAPDGKKIQKPEYFVPLRFISEEEEEAYNNSLDPSTMGESLAFVKFYKMLTHFEFRMGGGDAPAADAGDAKKGSPQASAAGDNKAKEGDKAAATETPTTSADEKPKAGADRESDDGAAAAQKEGAHTMENGDAPPQATDAGAGGDDLNATGQSNPKKVTGDDKRDSKETPKGSASGEIKRVRETQAAPLGADEAHYENPDDLSIKKFYAIPCCIIIVFQIVAVVHMYFAMQMGTPDQLPAFYPTDHMFQKNSAMQQNNYAGGSANGQIGVVMGFGVTEVSRENYSKWNPHVNRDDLRYYKNFEMYRADSLSKFWNMCDELTYKSCPVEGCKGFVDGNPLLFTQETMKCPVKAFLTQCATTLDASGNNVCTVDANGNTIPKWPSIATSADVAGIFASPSTVPALDTRQKFMDELSLFRLRDAPAAGGDWRQLIGFQKGELKHMYMHFRISLPLWQGYTKRATVLDWFEDWIDAKSNRGDGLGLGLLTDDQFWFAWTRSEEWLEYTLYVGVGVTAPAAGLVILVATGNFVLTIWSMLTITNIISIVIGSLKFWYDKDLDFITVICVIILIGFCCDYCLHVCHVFNEAKEHGIKRGDLRMRYALSRMGSTIFAGAVTTVGAGFFLYLAQTAFNQSVGFIIAFTIVVSLIFTLFFFSSLCIMFGPHGDFGDICCCCETRAPKGDKEDNKAAEDGKKDGKTETDTKKDSDKKTDANGTTAAKGNGSAAAPANSDV
jgi:hypothetical protein